MQETNSLDSLRVLGMAIAKRDIENRTYQFNLNPGFTISREILSSSVRSAQSILICPEDGDDFHHIVSKLRDVSKGVVIICAISDVEDLATFKVISEYANTTGIPYRMGLVIYHQIDEDPIY